MPWDLCLARTLSREQFAPDGLLVNVDLVKKKPQNGALIAGSSQSQLK